MMPRNPISRNNDQAITTLEEEVAHLARTNDELSSELAGQWQRIEALERKLERLGEKLQMVADNVDSPVEKDRPPHY